MNYRALEVPRLDIDDRLGHANPLKSLRGRVERRIVWTMCMYLAERGWTPKAVHGGDDGPVEVSTAKEAMELVFNLDDSAITFCKLASQHTVKLVLGNGEDCVADWGYTEGDADRFNAAMDSFLDLIPTFTC